MNNINRNNIIKTVGPFPCFSNGVKALPVSNGMNKKTPNKKTWRKKI